MSKIQTPLEEQGACWGGRQAIRAGTVSQKCSWDRSYNSPLESLSFRIKPARPKSVAVAGGCSCKLVSVIITTQPEHPKDIPGQRNICRLQRHLWKLSTKVFILAVRSADCGRVTDATLSQQSPIWQWGSTLCGGKKPKQLWYAWFLKARALLASPQAVILSELKLSRAKHALVIAQENPQAGKKEGKALE